MKIYETDEEYKTMYQGAIICPHCGFSHLDSHEWQMNPDEYYLETCEHCEKDFAVEKTIEITYSTKKIK